MPLQEDVILPGLPHAAAAIPAWRTSSAINLTPTIVTFTPAPMEAMGATNTPVGVRRAGSKALIAAAIIAPAVSRVSLP